MHKHKSIQTPTGGSFAIRPVAPCARGQAAAAASVAAAAEIFIYGDIGESWWDDTVEASTFVREIEAIQAGAITLRINSFGGSMPDGVAIHNAIRRHSARVTADIDGVAYSIASLIPMAADRVRAWRNAMLMVHMPHTGVRGNALEHRRIADVLDLHGEAMKTSYLARGIDAALVNQWMSDGQDHYYTAEQALAVGLVDEIIETEPSNAAATGSNPVLTAAQARYGVMAARGRVAVAFHHAVPAAPTNGAPIMDPENEPVAAQPVQAAATPTTPVAGAAAIVTQPSADRQTILAAEVNRRSDIRAQFQPFAQRDGVAALLRTCEDDVHCSPEAASQRLLAHLARGTEPVAAHGSPVVRTVEDEGDKHRNAQAQALMARAGLVQVEASNPFRGYTLTELARASAERSHVRGLGKMEMVAAAFTHSTSDFPALLQDVARRSLMRGYEEAAETFQLWTRTGSLSDFRPSKRVGVGAFPNLDKVPEGAEYKYGTVGDRGQSVVLATYGKLFSITRQAVINDDLGAFTDIPRKMGRAAIRTVGDLVYGVLLGNPILDEDGKPLFHADHGNLLPGAGITTESVDAISTALALQKGDGVQLNVPLKWLLVPVSLRGAAKLVRESTYEVGSTVKNNTVPNIARETFDIVADARLDAASKTTWYGAADANLHDTIEVNYLDGNQTPYLEQQQGWTVDGSQFKVRLDAGVNALDFRGLAKNPGA